MELPDATRHIKYFSKTNGYDLEHAINKFSLDVCIESIHTMVTPQGTYEAFVQYRK